LKPQRERRSRTSQWSGRFLHEKEGDAYVPSFLPTDSNMMYEATREIPYRVLDSGCSHPELQVRGERGLKGKEQARQIARNSAAASSEGTYETPDREWGKIQMKAIANYEHFYGIPVGCATMAQVENSCAGVRGWAARDGDIPEEAVERHRCLATSIKEM